MTPAERARRSLEGLSVGDAFGEQFFRRPFEEIRQRALPPATWRWTDDTAMALSVVEVLDAAGVAAPDPLAKAFAERYAHESWRGYGGGARELLEALALGADWRIEAPKLFDGGSYGNGGAMRAAPIGAWFAGDPTRAAAEARRSAAVTHGHPDGQAGAMAVAAATALMADPAGRALPPRRFIETVRDHLGPSETRERMGWAAEIRPDDFARAVRVLGTGNLVSAFDTVPFGVWVVAHQRGDFVEAMWTTVAGLGDRDTTCAIVGGILGGHLSPPAEWVARREPLPPGFAPGSIERGA